MLFKFPTETAKSNLDFPALLKTKSFLSRLNLSIGLNEIIEIILTYEDEGSRHCPRR